MRRIKVLGNAPGTYHVISRVVAGERLLEERDREVLRRQIRKMAVFCGVEILTYCILSNHFHLLVVVPPKAELSDGELVRRYGALYGKKEAAVLEENLRSEGLRSGLRNGLLKRMNDLSFFMKELKLRFTIYYNRTHGRFGTLWAEKFKSLLVESEERALVAVAAYIDLNPVRAGLCKDPKDFRFCGYAEAVAGGEAARKGLHGIIRGPNWSWVAREYRMVIFGAGVASDRSKEGGIDWETSREVLNSGGKLPLRDLVRLRFRYFSDGVALGSAAFIEKIRREHPAFGARVRPGRPPEMPVEGEGLRFARRGRSAPFATPTPP